MKELTKDCYLGKYFLLPKSESHCFVSATIQFDTSFGTLVVLRLTPKKVNRVLYGALFLLFYR